MLLTEGITSWMEVHWLLLMIISCVLGVIIAVVTESMGHGALVAISPIIIWIVIGLIGFAFWIVTIIALLIGLAIIEW